MNNSPPIVFEKISIDYKKSKGSYLFDLNTKSFYLDFFSNYSSLALGYEHDVFNDQYLREVNEVVKYKYCSNVYLNDIYIDAKNTLDSKLPYRHNHFCNSGASAVEAGIKSVLFASKEKKGGKIIAFRKSFHGVYSWGQATDKYSFTGERLINNENNIFYHCEPEEVVTAIRENNIIGVLIEPIMCTSGDIYIEKNTLLEIASCAKEFNIPIIFDEIQTGFGATGYWWYFQRLGIVPDILIFGKKSQISGISVSEKYCEIIYSKKFPVHATFDGDLIDLIRSKYIIKAIDNGDLLNKILNRENYIRGCFNKLGYVPRLAGNLWAFDFETNCMRNQFWNNLLSEKIMVNRGGDVSLRIRPSLAVTNDEINFFFDGLEKVSKNI